MFNDLTKIVFEQIIPSGCLWVFWQIILQINLARKWKKFTKTATLGNLFTAFWVACIAGSLLQDDYWDIRFWLTSISWFLAIPIVDALMRIKKDDFTKLLGLLYKRLLWKNY